MKHEQKKMYRYLYVYILGATCFYNADECEGNDKLQGARGMSVTFDCRRVQNG